MILVPKRVIGPNRYKRASRLWSLALWATLIQRVDELLSVHCLLALNLLHCIHVHNVVHFRLLKGLHTPSCCEHVVAVCQGERSIVSVSTVDRALPDVIFSKWSVRRQEHTFNPDIDSEPAPKRRKVDRQGTQQAWSSTQQPTRTSFADVLARLKEEAHESTGVPCVLRVLNSPAHTHAFRIRRRCRQLGTSGINSHRPT